MTSAGANAWRPIIALLASTDARAVYAQVILDAESDAGATAVRNLT